MRLFWVDHVGEPCLMYAPQTPTSSLAPSLNVELRLCDDVYDLPGAPAYWWLVGAKGM